MARKYMRRGLGIIGTGMIIGSMPNISGSAAETTIKTNTMTGLANVSSTFPMHGKLIGAGMVLKQTKKLRKSTRRLL